MRLLKCHFFNTVIFQKLSPLNYILGAKTLGILIICSTELWNLNLLDNTLNQIEYYLESGSIAQASDALLLCDKMIALLAHLKQMTEEGKKFPVGAKTMEGRKFFHLFHNEMVDTNNTIIVETPRGKAIYSTFGNPNLLQTTDQRVTTYIAIMRRKHGTSISIA